MEGSEVSQMSQISDDIKNKSFKDIYLLYGDEAYLRESYRRALVNALTVPSDTLNYASFSGDSVTAQEIVSLASTLPFMAEKRVVVVRDCGFFKNTCDELGEYLKSPSHDTVLIFDESSVDKRNKNYKAASAAGAVIEAKAPNEMELKRWIAAFLARSGKKIRENTAELLISRAGTDMSMLDSELKKLISYTGDRTAVTDADILAVCVRNPSNTVFQMIDAMALKKKNEAVAIYYDMLAEKENPYGILSLIERHFRILLMVTELSEKKEPQQVIASKAGIPPFTVSKYMAQTRKYTKGKIIGLLEDCAAGDAASKLGRISDSLAVELIIIKYSV